MAALNHNMLPMTLDSGLREREFGGDELAFSVPVFQSHP